MQCISSSVNHSRPQCRAVPLQNHPHPPPLNNVFMHPKIPGYIQALVCLGSVALDASLYVSILSFSYNMGLVAITACSGYAK